MHYLTPVLKFLIFSKNYFQKHKSSAQPLNSDWMWLINELVLTFSAPKKCAKAQFNLIILSRVMPHTTYRQTDRQTDRHFRKNPFFWLRVSQNVNETTSFWTHFIENFDGIQLLKKTNLITHRIKIKLSFKQSSKNKWSHNFGR